VNSRERQDRFGVVARDGQQTLQCVDGEALARLDLSLFRRATRDLEAERRTTKEGPEIVRMQFENPSIGLESLLEAFVSLVEHPDAAQVILSWIDSGGPRIVDQGARVITLCDSALCEEYMGIRILAADPAHALGGFASGLMIDDRILEDELAVMQMEQCGRDPGGATREYDWSDGREADSGIRIRPLR
jgi:hypothetical protein